MPYLFTLPSPSVNVSGDTFSYCAVLANGQVACWGDYISNTTPWLFPEGPRVVAGLDSVASVAAGFGYYCTLKRDGTVWCWGDNDVGQTGTPPAMAERCAVGRQTTPIPADVYVSCVRQPRRVEGLTDVVEIDVGGFFACARKRDGTVWCWGDNSTPPHVPRGTVGGYIGDGMPNTETCLQEPWVPASATPPPRPCRARPTRVAGLTNATALAVGNFYACVALASEQIRCWGQNDFGALGDGTDIGRTTPVPVIAPR